MTFSEKVALGFTLAFLVVAGAAIGAADHARNRAEKAEALAERYAGQLRAAEAELDRAEALCR
jgi:hypothetical protein